MDAQTFLAALAKIFKHLTNWVGLHLNDAALIGGKALLHIVGAGNANSH